MLDIVLLIAVVVLPAIILHEIAHGMMALAFGDSTARDSGRLTLNPIKHLDLVGSLIVPGFFYLMFVVGMMKTLMLFGWAKPVPVNTERLKSKRLGMACVALAGPVINLLIAVFFVQLYRMPVFNDINHVIMWGIFFNVMLAVFNMLPIPPLDGSRIVMSMLPQALARSFVKTEKFGFIILVILLQLGLLEFLYPLISQIINLLGAV